MNLLLRLWSVSAPLSSAGIIFAPVANASCFFTYGCWLGHYWGFLLISCCRLLDFELKLMFWGSFQIHREKEEYLDRFFNQVKEVSIICALGNLDIACSSIGTGCLKYVLCTPNVSIFAVTE